MSYHEEIFKMDTEDFTENSEPQSSVNLKSTSHSKPPSQTHSQSKPPSQPHSTAQSQADVAHFIFNISSTDTNSKPQSAQPSQNGQGQGVISQMVHEGKEDPDQSIISSTADTSNLEGKKVSDVMKIRGQSKYSALDRLWLSSKYHYPDLLAQWNCLIHRISKQELEHTFQLSSTQVYGAINLCDALKADHRIKFRTFELLERFLTIFLKKMTHHLRNATKEDWGIFEDRFRSQILLRVSTCILIASKLHADTHAKIIPVSSIAKLLVQKGQPFSIQHIHRSELRVLETLGYRCHWVMPLDLVEQLLCLIGLNREELKEAHHFSILLLEFCYSELNIIRLKFKESSKKKDATISIPLLCAAIVAAALFIMSIDTKRSFHQMVLKTAGVPEDEVNTLAILILDYLNTAEQEMVSKEPKKTSG